MSKSVDPDETAHNEPSHLDLRCLQTPIIITFGSERVNATCYTPLFLKREITSETFCLLPCTQTPFEKMIL